MALFGKKKSNGNGNGGGEAPVVKRDFRKAEKFFEHARNQSDTRHDDYAIELFINGLRHDPGNVNIHEELREVALKRKVRGGKPAGFKEKMGGGKNPVDKFLHAEKLWSKEPLNIDRMLEVMRLAVDVSKGEEDLNFNEVAYWIGGLFLEGHQTTKQPDWKTYVEIRDLFTEIGAFGQAVDACRLALGQKPGDDRLLAELKDLEAERMVNDGSIGTGEEGGFRNAVRDMDEQQKLIEEDSIIKSDEMKSSLVERYREEFTEKPDDIDLMMKLVNALTAKEDEDEENEAIDILEKFYAKSQQYRLKISIGDLRIKQMNRAQAKLKRAVESNSQDAAAKKEWQQAQRDQLDFELAEFTDRVKNYPTDLGIKFELGRRLFAFKKYTDAISMFQQSKGDARCRSASHEYLGRCYQIEQWYEEAIDTFRSGIEQHPVADDRMGMTLRYRLMTALRDLARKNKDIEIAQEAQQIASKILQTDITYRDIREQMNEIRELVDELRG